MRKFLAILLFVLTSCVTLYAEGDTIVLPTLDSAQVIYADTTSSFYNTTDKPDSVVVINSESPTLMSYELMWTPDPLRATWLAVIVPGLGQIYNRSYWKLPIVYGGLMGCGFAISQNGSKYEAYKQAYRDILADANNISSDPNRSYNAILPEGYTIERMGGVSNYTSVLKDRQNTYRRYRDISIVVGILVYALSIIDAYVDAQLFDFDISDDLSINIEPQLYQDTYIPNQRSAELKLAISF